MLTRSDCGKILKGEMHERLQWVIDLAYIRLESGLYRVEAYPDMVMRGRVNFLLTALKLGAKNASEIPVVQRARRT